MQQHPHYGAACRALGSGVRRFALHDAGRALASAQVLVRRWPMIGCFALLARGPVWSTDLGAADRIVALDDLMLLLRSEHRGVMATPDRISGRDPLDRGGWLPMVTPCHVAVLDLTPSVEALRAAQNGKWRNRLVKAESAGLTVTDAPLPPEPGHWLLTTEAAQSAARGYSRLPVAFTVAWAAAGGRKATRVFTAYREGRAVAAMLFLLHGTGASYHIGWSGPDGRDSGAHPLLLWRAALWLRSKGYRAVDLGTLDTEATPGLARFKLGAGAKPVALGATRLWGPGTAAVAALNRWLGGAAREPVSPRHKDRLTATGNRILARQSQSAGPGGSAP